MDKTLIEANLTKLSWGSKNEAYLFNLLLHSGAVGKHFYIKNPFGNKDKNYCIQCLGHGCGKSNANHRSDAGLFISRAQ